MLLFDVGGALFPLRRGSIPKDEARGGVAQSLLDLRDDHLDRDCVVPAPRHNDVRVALARLDELQVHRLHGRQVLVDDFVEGPSAGAHVAADAANEPDVGIGVDEHFHVAELAARVGRRRAGFRR